MSPQQLAPTSPTTSGPTSVLAPASSSPIESGPEIAIPHTAIPHLGTSQARVANPTTAPDGAVTPPNGPTPHHTAKSAPQTVSVALPPLPQGVTQEAIDGAIKQVEQTGSTEGIPPDILGAACAQLEVRARAQGIDLNQAPPPDATQQAPQQAPAGPSNYVEAAVLDKKSVMDGFSQQRDKLKSAVSDQRDAMQQPYKDALEKAGQGNAGGADSISPELMGELASMAKDLDPATMAIINAISAMSKNPSILNSVMWIEIIRSIRRMIADEARKQLQLMLNTNEA